jgi:hypothetical protein
MESCQICTPKRCDVYAGHGYYLGASSSPSFVLVLAADDTMVTHVDAHRLSVSRTPRWIFEDLAETARETITRDYNRAGAAAVGADRTTAAGRLVILCAKRAEECWESNGAPVVFAEYDRVRFVVTCDGDAYSADRFGVLVDFDGDKNVATIETARSLASAFEAAGFRILSTETIKACPTTA